ncbi:MAG: hypothetical protein R2724_13315 [Bryobacterales bacterium]
MAAAAGALQEPRDAFRAADLEHPIDLRKVHAQVEARGADNCAQAPGAQPILDPKPHFRIERAVVQAISPAQSGRASRSA